MYRCVYVPISSLSALGKESLLVPSKQCECAVEITCHQNYVPKIKRASEITFHSSDCTIIQSLT